MVGVVIAAHGRVASALLSAAELIAGRQDQITAVSFEPGVAFADLEFRMAAAIKQVDNKQGVLVLADLLGGSPYNAAAMLSMKQSGIEIVAGVNLPMLLEVLSARNGELQEVADVAFMSGGSGIHKLVFPKVE